MNQASSDSRVRKAFALFALSLLWVNVPVLLPFFGEARSLQAQAQSTAERKAEADRLFQQGIEQYRIGEAE
jgi:hypothetical protein